MLISAVQQSDSVILFHILFHYGLSQNIEYISLCYTVGPCCLSILYINIIGCICSSQIPNPPLLLLPWQSQVCSLFDFAFKLHAVYDLSKSLSKDSSSSAKQGRNSIASHPGELVRLQQYNPCKLLKFLLQGLNNCVLSF